MGLAGEREQNLWKEMSCRQNIENVRLSGTELNLRMNVLLTFMTQVVGVTSREKARGPASSRFSVLSSQISGPGCFQLESRRGVRLRRCRFFDASDSKFSSKSIRDRLTPVSGLSSITKI